MWPVNRTTRECLWYQAWNMTLISTPSYSTWYAYWGKNKPSVNSVWAFANTMTVPTQYDLWQFTSKGNAPGIAGLLDCDLLLNNSILK